MKRPLALVVGLLIIGVMGESAGAYSNIDWNKYTTTVSYYSSSARVDETVFLYGEYPKISAGAQQTLIISSFTGIDNEPLCHLSSGCFMPRNKRISVFQVAGPTNVEYELWWVGDNDGNGIPSNYASLINGAVEYMINKIASNIPYADLVIDAVKLLTRYDYSQSGPQLIISPSFSRSIGNHITGGMILRVKPTDTGKLPSGTYTYRIKARSTTSIWFNGHSSWVFSKNGEITNKVSPMSTSVYIKTVSISETYTLTVVKNW